MGIWNQAMARHHSAVVVAALVIGLALSVDQPDDDIKWEFDPQKFTVCSTNFESHPDLSLDDCKSLCIQNSGCDQFSFPIQDQKLGCRLAKQGGCEPRNADGPGYNLYQKKKAAQDEPADEEGSGARRRRRTDARRRTHSQIMTSATNEMTRIIEQQKKEALQIAKASEAAAAGEQAAEREHKLQLAQKDVEKQSLDMKIKRDIEEKVAGDSSSSSSSSSAEGGAGAAYARAESHLAAVKNDLKNLKAQARVDRTNTETAQGALEITDAQRDVVNNKIKFAVQSVEQLMQSPGKLADEDRMIAVAILGKLRVAAALVRGDLPALDRHQSRVDWVSNLKQTMLKAVRNPSAANMEAARAAYKTAAAMKAKEQEDTNAAEEAEAKELQEQAQAKQIQEETAEAEQEAEQKEAEEQAQIDSATATQAAIEKANEADPTAPDPQVSVTVKAPPPPPPIPTKVIQRGFYDPIESE